ncbi:FOG: Ankyrin repeat [Phaffia rhodozyma]|uniref:FOG: Ankyrin repeat n=1 Tax=Phaffia rhodozyma TaxID=264483 RepID=A0A0F7SNQ4_PHARH|nr:FOG: Ankyrin repeat [Phaffia rhodozyma]
MGSTENQNIPSKPAEEELEDILLSCRYGELEEVQSFVSQYGINALADARDDRGCGCLHMVSGNGHIDLLNYLLPLLPPTQFSLQNSSGSTALHWASLNGHLPIVKALILHPSSPGDKLIDIKNSSGHTAVGEAEMMERNEVAVWLVGRMLLGDDKEPEANKEDRDEKQPVGVEDKDGEDDEEEVELYRMSLNDKGEVEVKEPENKA